MRVLDISNNRIEKIENLNHLTELEELWASYNQIDSFENIIEGLADNKKIATVYFEGNPVQKNNAQSYRLKLKLAFPSLIQIDATYIRQS